MNTRLKPTDHPDVLEAKSGGGCLVIFGLPFLLVGLLFMASSLGLIPGQTETPPWYIGIPFGGVFAAVGAGLVFGRAGLRVNRKEKTAFKWISIILPIKKSYNSLEGYSRILLKKEIQKSNDGSRTIYPVSLDGNPESKPFELENSLDYQKARSSAEELAKFFSLPLVDSSSGEEVRREVDKLDESLRDKMARSDEWTASVSRPYDCKARVVPHGSSLIIEFPKKGLQIIHLVGLVFALIFSCIAASFFSISISDLQSWRTWNIAETVFAIVGLGMITLPVLITLFRTLFDATSHQKIETTNDIFRVEERRIIGKKIQEIPISELEELVIPESDKQKFLEELQSKPDAGKASPEIVNFILKFLKHPGITARSDKLSICFGKGQPPADLNYVHALIKQRIAGR